MPVSIHLPNLKPYHVDFHEITDWECFCRLEDRCCLLSPPTSEDECLILALCLPRVRELARGVDEALLTLSECSLLRRVRDELLSLPLLEDLHTDEALRVDDLRILPLLAELALRFEDRLTEAVEALMLEDLLAAD